MREIFWRVFYMWEILQGNLNTTNISQMQETHGQYWGIRKYRLGYDPKIFLHWSYCKERQSFVIFFIADKELIIFIIYSLLSFAFPSVFRFKEISHGKSPCKQACISVFLYFVCVCNVNFEEIFLCSMILNP